MYSQNRPRSLEVCGVLTDRSSRQVLLYLLRRCYGLCYRLMASSEPVSEELMPIANVSLSLLFGTTPRPPFLEQNLMCAVYVETQHDQAVSQ